MTETPQKNQPFANLLKARIERTLRGLPKFPSRSPGRRPGLPQLPVAAGAEVCDELPSGLTRCYSEDGTTITFGDDSGWIKFRSYTESKWPAYKRIGTKITTFGPKFDAARIDSHYYVRAYNQAVAVVYDQDSDTNDNFLSEYSQALGPFAELPVRVESLCRAQWHGHRITATVAKGSLDNSIVVGTVNPFPSGWPEDWPPLPEPEVPPRLQVSPRSMSFAPGNDAPVSSKSILITSTFDVAKPVLIGSIEVDAEALSDPFSVQTGSFTIPPDGQLSVDVVFDGSLTKPVPGSYGPQAVSGFFIVNGGTEGSFRINLQGQMHQVFHQ